MALRIPLQDSLCLLGCWSVVRLKKLIHGLLSLVFSVVRVSPKFVHFCLLEQPMDRRCPGKVSGSSMFTLSA